MAFPINYDGIGRHTAITLKHSTLVKGADEGKAVSISSNDTVVIGPNNSKIHGIVTAIEKDVCTVEFDGVYELDYSGSDPSAGIVSLSCDGAGKVNVDATNGKEYLALRVNTTTKKVWVLIR